MGLCNSNKGLEAKWNSASIYMEGLVTLSQPAFLNPAP